MLTTFSVNHVAHKHNTIKMFDFFTLLLGN